MTRHVNRFCIGDSVTVRGTAYVGQVSGITVLDGVLSYFLVGTVPFPWEIQPACGTKGYAEKDLEFAEPFYTPGVLPDTHAIQMVNMDGAYRYVKSSVPYLRAAYDETLSLKERLWAMAEARMHTINALAAGIQNNDTAFWQHVYPEGMTAEAVRNELSDFRRLMQNVTVVYEAVSNGFISKVNTDASEVLAKFKEHFVPKDDLKHAQIFLWEEEEKPKYYNGYSIPKEGHELLSPVLAEGVQELSTQFENLKDAAKKVVAYRHQLAPEDIDRLASAMGNVQ